MPTPRVYHPWWKWECYKAGFYGSSPPDGVDKDQALVMYKDFLSDVPGFEAAMQKVSEQWPNSCQQFLTNPSINRVAWLGQSSMCISTGVPSKFRAGFKLLSTEQQAAANAAAEAHLKRWLSELEATLETVG